MEISAHSINNLGLSELGLVLSAPFSGHCFPLPSSLMQFGLSICFRYHYLSFSFQGRADCKDGWVRFRGSCYLFSTLDKVRIDTARVRLQESIRITKTCLYNIWMF